MVRVKGVYRRVATDDDKNCHSEECLGTIWTGSTYARVLRDDGRLEMFHEECFKDEFGEALHA